MSIESIHKETHDELVEQLYAHHAIQHHRPSRRPLVTGELVHANGVIGKAVDVLYLFRNPAVNR